MLSHPRQSRTQPGSPGSWASQRRGGSRSTGRSGRSRRPATVVRPPAAPACTRLAGTAQGRPPNHSHTGAGMQECLTADPSEAAAHQLLGGKGTKRRATGRELACDDGGAHTALLERTARPTSPDKAVALAQVRHLLPPLHVDAFLDSARAHRHRPAGHSSCLGA